MKRTMEQLQGEVLTTLCKAKQNGESLRGRRILLAEDHPLNAQSAKKLLGKRARPDAATVPIIAMAANAHEENVQKSLEAGMDEHLAKPVEPELLYKTLTKHIQGGTQHGK